MNKLSQREIAAQLLDEAQSDGHQCDLGVLDLLDYMAILGVEFAPGTAASKAYFEQIAEGAS